jgi:fatty-acyl-CoA synthase
VRFDPESQQPIRDKWGFCIECQVDEPGEVIGKIIKHASKPGQRFEGYASEIETDRKILHDVFKTGDLWFRTGDLMRKDKNGYFYFIDRVGDTFRWKGENVSTTEVEEAMGRFDGILESNVYGVQIAGRDGRAGMAAIVARDNLNLTALRDHIAQQLPEYARPVFLRIRKDNDVTTTFKQKKINLLKEGFDPSRTSDPIYFNDPQRKAFVRLDPALHEQINSGRVRL